MNDKGGKIEPSSFHAPSISPLPPIPFTLNRYFSVYDLSYPVLVTIRDTAALNGRGYTFAFALESTSAIMLYRLTDAGVATDSAGAGKYGLRF